MDPGTATVTAALVTGAAAIITAVVAKHDLHLLIQRAPLNLAGRWKGRSAYLAGRLFDPTTECHWKVETTISQRGRTLVLTIVLTDFYDLTRRKIGGLSPREFRGKGRLKGDRDVIVQFQQTHGLEHGVMYLVSDLRGDELEGILVVRNPTLTGPVAIKFILSRNGKRTIDFGDLGNEHLSEAILRAPEHKSAAAGRKEDGTASNK